MNCWDDSDVPSWLLPKIFLPLIFHPWGLWGKARVTEFVFTVTMPELVSGKGTWRFTPDAPRSSQQSLVILFLSIYAM